MDVNEELKFLGKLKKNNFFLEGGGPGGGGSGWGVRVDVNEELTFLEKITQKKIGGEDWGDPVAEGVRWGRVGGGGGVRVDVNAMLGLGGDVGYGGCEPRFKVLYNVQKV